MTPVLSAANVLASRFAANVNTDQFSRVAPQAKVQRDAFSQVGFAKPKSSVFLSPTRNAFANPAVLTKSSHWFGPTVDSVKFSGVVLPHEPFMTSIFALREGSELDLTEYNNDKTPGVRQFALDKDLNWDDLSDYGGMKFQVVPTAFLPPLHGAQYDIKSVVGEKMTLGSIHRQGTQAPVNLYQAKVADPNKAVVYSISPLSRKTSDEKPVYVLGLPGSTVNYEGNRVQLNNGFMFDMTDGLVPDTNSWLSKLNNPSRDDLSRVHLFITAGGVASRFDFSGQNKPGTKLETVTLPNGKTVNLSLASRQALMAYANGIDLVTLHTAYDGDHIINSMRELKNALDDETFKVADFRENRSKPKSGSGTATGMAQVLPDTVYLTDEQGQFLLDSTHRFLSDTNNSSKQYFPLVAQIASNLARYNNAPPIDDPHSSKRYLGLVLNSNTERGAKDIETGAKYMFKNHPINHKDREMMVVQGDGVTDIQPAEFLKTHETPFSNGSLQGRLPVLSIAFQDRTVIKKPGQPTNEEKQKDFFNLANFGIALVEPETNRVLGFVEKPGAGVDLHGKLVLSWEDAVRNLEERAEIIRQQYAEKGQNVRFDLNARYVNSGMYMLNRDGADLLSLFYDAATEKRKDPKKQILDWGGDFIPALVDLGLPVKAHVFKQYWNDVGDLLNFWATVKQLDAHKKPQEKMMQDDVIVEPAARSVFEAFKKQGKIEVTGPAIVMTANNVAA